MKKLVLVLLMMMSAFQLSFADSPLTSTDFYKAYLDVPIVAAAAKNPGKLSNEAKAYLFDEDNPLDVKLALINVVGWRMEGLSTYTDYLRYCFNHFPKAKFGIDEKKFLTKKDLFYYVSSEQMAVLVYMYAMSNYFDSKGMFSLMQQAMLKPIRDRQSFMMAMGLVYAQTCLDNPQRWGKIYTSMTHHINSPQIKDMRPEAIEIVMEYINLYKEESE